MSPTADERIEQKTQDVDHGFWDRVNEVVFSAKTERTMSRTCDRFNEARHFLQLIRALPPVDGSVDRANWYLGAHLNAVIGIREAGKIDYKDAGRGSFNFTPLSKEFYLRSDDPNAVDRDPTALNRVYKTLRNLRVHRAVKLVTLEERVLQPDIFLGQPARKRWFVRRLTQEDLTVEGDNQSLLTPDDLERFIVYSEKRTLIAVAAQHLSILARLIEEVGTRLR